MLPVHHAVAQQAATATGDMRPMFLKAAKALHTHTPSDTWASPEPVSLTGHLPEPYTGYSVRGVFDYGTQTETPWLKFCLGHFGSNGLARVL